jgi:transcriptional regulator with XRE-family HTH domain
MGPNTSAEYAVDGAKLTAARVGAGISMEDMAQRIGGNKANLSRWERGITNPSDRHILRLAVVLGRTDFIKER